MFRKELENRLTVKNLHAIHKTMLYYNGIKQITTNLDFHH